MSSAELGEMVRNLVHAYKHGATDDELGEGVMQIAEAAMDTVIEKQLLAPSTEGAFGAPVEDMQPTSECAEKIFGSSPWKR